MSLFNNKNIATGREKPLPPEQQARVHIIEASVGAATVALADQPDVVHQPGLPPFVGATVTDIHARREEQRTAAPLTSIVETPAIAPEAVSEGARTVVMNSAIEANSMPKAA